MIRPLLLGLTSAIATTVFATACAATPAPASTADDNPPPPSHQAANHTGTANVTGAGNSGTAGTDTPSHGRTSSNRSEFQVTVVRESSPRRPVWRASQGKNEVTIALEFAPEGESAFDAMGDDLRAAGLAETQRTVGQFVLHHFVGLREWIVAFQCVPQLDRLTVVFVENLAGAAAAPPTAGGGWSTIRVGMDALVTGEFLRELYLRMLGPEAPAFLVLGLAELGLHDRDAIARRGGRELALFAWLWAAHAGFFADSLVDVGPLMAPVDESVDVPPLAMAQVADFVAYLSARFGEHNLIAACVPEKVERFRDAAAGYVTEWIADRQETYVPEFDEKFRATLKFWAGEWEAAVALMPTVLTVLSVRSIPAPMLTEGFGELAFLTRRYDFCRTWLLDELMADEFNAHLLGRQATAPAPMFVPTRLIPWPAAVAGAFEDAATAELTAAVLLRAGRRDLAGVVRAIRGLIDSPDDLAMRRRIAEWGRLPGQSPDVATVLTALALQAAGRSEAAAHAAETLPDGHWRRALENSQK